MGWEKERLIFVSKYFPHKEGKTILVRVAKNVERELPKSLNRQYDLPLIL
jgi:hypothetical protein